MLKFRPIKFVTALFTAMLCWHAVSAPVDEHQAIARAVNKLESSNLGIVLYNPGHTVEYTRQGVAFLPSSGAPEWRWQLASISHQSDQSGYSEVLPVNSSGDDVHYQRGDITEQYLAKANTIEQRFVLGNPPALDGRDFVITGNIQSDGEFASTADGWRWRNRNGEVKLGTVTVFDADGRILPAQMTVTSRQSEIVVAAEVLAAASYPVTIDPEIGANDFRISDAGGSGTVTARPEIAAVAYNSTDNEYLVVWEADDTDTTGIVDEEVEIFGQRIDAATGEELGDNDFRISDANGTGAGGGPNGAFNPAVAYNSTNNEYLVVWQSGDTDTLGISAGETEIFGQRLNAATGAEMGTNDFRISDIGVDGVAGADARSPAVAYNPTINEYLVVWHGDGEPGLANNETEIYGQRLDASTGDEVGTNDFRISVTGPDNDAGFVAMTADVAYNSTDEEYLVVWYANRGMTGVFSDREIFGQRLIAATGAETGDDDFRISDAGVEDEPGPLAIDPRVAYNSVDNEYLVVWESNDPEVLASGGGEMEIFGQRLDNTGAEIGPNDFLVSDAQGIGGQSFDATRPGIAYNPVDNEYLVVWDADDIDSPGVENNEFEIFGQRIAGGTGAAVGANDFRISDAGGDGLNGIDARNARVTASTTGSEYLVVWEADDTDTSGIVADEFEIFGQRLSFAPDLAISKTNNANFITGDVPVTYTITVSNVGGMAITGATVTDILPGNLTNADWVCDADDGASCTASGMGSIMDDMVDLDIGTSVTYTLTVDPVVAETDTVSNTATVSLPVGTTDTNLSNNSATDTDIVAGVFADSFENSE